MTRKNYNGKAIWTQKSFLIFGANHEIETRTVVFAASKRSLEDGKQQHFFLKMCTKKPGLHPIICFERYHTLQEYNLAYSY
jgi:hypothetical protein